MRKTAPALILFFLFVWCSQDGKANSSNKTGGEEIIQKAHQAFYYPGTDMKARITMELLDKSGYKRERILTMLRLNQKEEGNQKYYLYFHYPPDVKRLVFMVWKYPKKDDDRWIYIPAVDLVRRIAASDARSSFVGSDFTYEDISGRDTSLDTHRLVREEKYGKRACYLVESKPKKAAEYVKKLSWIDKKTSLPLKEEYYDLQGELFRIFTTDRVRTVKAVKGGKKVSYPTVIRRTMKNVKTGHKTVVTFRDVAYEIGLKEKVFTERYLRRPPQKWIQ